MKPSHGLMAAIVTLAIAPLARAGTTNLVTNGSFESPGAPPGFAIRATISSVNGSAPGQAQVDGENITGWTYNGAGFAIYENNQDGILPADGSFYISMGHDGAQGEAFSQDIGISSSGVAYTLSYAVAEQQETDPTEDVQAVISSDLGMFIKVDNTNIGSPFKAGTPISFVGDGSDITVSFVDVSSSGDANTAIDNVCIAPTGQCGPAVTSAMPGVPEPATWALMLVGFGAVGAALRSRRTAATV